MLPRLPTVPTRLQLGMGKVYVAAGHLILALRPGDPETARVEWKDDRHGYQQEELEAKPKLELTLKKEKQQQQQQQQQQDNVTYNSR